MPARCSVFIDAGYLLASAATRVTGTSLRSGIHVEFGKLIAGVRSQAEAITGLPVLRIHWYDSARNGVPDYTQQRIGELPRVKLRLGRFGIDGQQKGVDLRLGLDLVTHARNQAAEVFLLVSGDDDLTEAVEEAQVHGVEVVLLAAPNAHGSAHAVSRHLLRAADELHVIDGALIDEAVLKVELPRIEPETDDAGAEGAPSPDVSPGEGAASPAGEGSPAASREAARDEPAQDEAVRDEPAPDEAVRAAKATPDLRPVSARAASAAAAVAAIAAASSAAQAPAPRPGEARPVPAPGPGPRPVPPTGSAPGAPAAPAPAAPRPSGAELARPSPAPAKAAVPAPPSAPRTPKDVAAVTRRPDGDVAADAVDRPSAWADEFDATIATVVGRVLNSLAVTSTPTAWRALELGRPSIPREVDKALLIDVTAAMGVLDLSDLERHEIRAAFWTAYDAMMAAARV